MFGFVVGICSWFIVRGLMKGFNEKYNRPWDGVDDFLNVLIAICFGIVIVLITRSIVGVALYKLNTGGNRQIKYY